MARVTKRHRTVVRRAAGGEERGPCPCRLITASRLPSASVQMNRVPELFSGGHNTRNPATPSTLFLPTAVGTCFHDTHDASSRKAPRCRCAGRRKRDRARCQWHHRQYVIRAPITVYLSQQLLIRCAIESTRTQRATSKAANGVVDAPKSAPRKPSPLSPLLLSANRPEQPKVAQRRTRLPRPHPKRRPSARRTPKAHRKERPTSLLPSARRMKM